MGKLKELRTINSVQATLFWVAEMSGVEILKSQANTALYYVTRKGDEIGYLLYRTKKKTLFYRTKFKGAWEPEANPVKALRRLITRYKEEANA
ncbi:MAG TPA: hypothetical protein VNA25_04975 [Phycisphaerae bacterium]|nr:hypothetical protein [Phycisphaerae bacterium]